jgi:hypothetical protein
MLAAVWQSCMSACQHVRCWPAALPPWLLVHQGFLQLECQAGSTASIAQLHGQHVLGWEWSGGMHACLWVGGPLSRGSQPASS